MKKKCNILAVCCFVLAMAIFAFSYILYHHTLPGGGFTAVWQSTPGKPMVTLLVAIWGVMFLFSSVMSALSALIFFPNNKK